jgi:hypothetical protein
MIQSCTMNGVCVALFWWGNNLQVIVDDSSRTPVSDL